MQVTLQAVEGRSLEPVGGWTAERNPVATPHRVGIRDGDVGGANGGNQEAKVSSNRRSKTRITHRLGSRLIC